MNRFLQFFLHYGLVVAVLVWAAVVGLMAYHLDDSPWRWAFVSLAGAGMVTVGGILWLRKYIDSLSRSAKGETRP